MSTSPARGNITEVRPPLPRHFAWQFDTLQRLIDETKFPNRVALNGQLQHASVWWRQREYISFHFRSRRRQRRDQPVPECLEYLKDDGLMTCPAAAIASATGVIALVQTQTGKSTCNTGVDLPDTALASSNTL